VKYLGIVALGLIVLTGIQQVTQPSVIELLGQALLLFLKAEWIFLEALFTIFMGKTRLLGDIGFLKLTVVVTAANILLVWFSIKTGRFLKSRLSTKLKKEEHLSSSSLNDMFRQEGRRLGSDRRK